MTGLKRFTREFLLYVALPLPLLCVLHATFTGAAWLSTELLEIAARSLP